MTTTIPQDQRLVRLVRRRKEAQDKRREIVDAAQAEKREQLTDDEDKAFRELSDEIKQYDERIDELTEELSPPGSMTEGAAALARAQQAGSETRAATAAWADRAATAIGQMSGEARAVVSGSVDVPTLVIPQVVGLPNRPDRLIDLLTNRQSVDGNAFSFVQQTVKTTNADVVADNQEKPTSVYTVVQVDDRVRVVAHLSEPVPNRIFDDHENIRQWLQTEMAEGVLDGLEAQIVAGDGDGENMEGILEIDGTTPVADAGDPLTTIRKAFTALQVLHETPTALVWHPADAETVDLTREESDGLFLAAPFGNLSNVFAATPRIASTSVPPGTAVLADWDQLRLFVRHEVRIDLDTSGVLFEKNQFKARAEGRFGIGVLRPQAFAILDLGTGGS